MRELRQMKDLRHENVNTFIGIFLDQTSPAMIFEYGQRGSLEVRIYSFLHRFLPDSLFHKSLSP